MPVATRPRIATFLGVIAIAVCGGGAPGPTTRLAPPAAARVAAPASAAHVPAPANIPALEPALAPPPAAAREEAIFGTAASADRFAAVSAEPLPDSITYEADTIVYSRTLSGDEAGSEMSVRYHAAGNGPFAPPATFDASGFNTLKIQLASTTDALLSIRLQTHPVAADGCTATASVLVDAPTTELVLDLDAATFTLPAHCAGGTDIAAIKAALHAIDIVNPATTAGAHEFRVGTARLGY
jgi:hypothetical protein